MLNIRLAATGALLALTTLVGALPKVSRTGKYLYSEDGTRFFIKGIAYQTQGKQALFQDRKNTSHL
jgi:hypothetical protein